MSLLAAGIGVVSGFIGGGPDYASSLAETNAAGKAAMAGDRSGSPDPLTRLQNKQRSQFPEVRAAAKSWLARLAVQGPTAEIRAAAGGALAGGTTLPPTSTDTGVTTIATRPVAGLPVWLWLGAGALVLWFIFKRKG